MDIFYRMLDPKRVIGRGMKIVDGRQMARSCCVAFLMTGMGGISIPS